MRKTEILLRDKAVFSAFFVLDHFFGRKNVERLLGGARRALKRRITDQLRAAGEGRQVPVPRAGTLSPDEFFTRCGRPGVPVVFSEVAKDWKACREWSFDSFRARFGDDEAILVNHEIYGKAVGAAPYEFTTLRDIIDQMRSGGQKYVRFHPLLDRHKELLDDIDQRWLTDRMFEMTGDGYRFHTLFLGGAGTKTPIHSAGNENLFLQIEGKKRWHLWPATHTIIFDPEANRGPAKYCDLAPSNPDYGKYQAYRYADTWTVDLNPGELLYVPAYVWHHVENLSPAIGVGFRWTALRNTFRRSPLLAIMEIFNTNPSLFAAFSREGEIDFNRLIMMSMGHGDRLREHEAARLEDRGPAAV